VGRTIGQGGKPKAEIYLKIEGLNPAGSVKLKTAIALIEDAEQKGVLTPGGRVVESSSGNLGIALSMVCTVKGYSFTCITDPNASSRSIATMRALGAQVVVVTERDEKGGYLGSRISLLKNMLALDPDLIWPNQYANTANPRVHLERTATSILKTVRSVDYLFVGAGTTGTLMGCAAYFRQFSPHTRIIAVDTYGSVTFGYPPGPRYIPGLGTSRAPELCQAHFLDTVVLVEEVDAVRMCRRITAEYGLLIGGSTGSVLAAVQSRRAEIPSGSRVVAIAPDLGDRYLDTIYNDDWVTARFGSQAPIEDQLASTTATTGR
jgi:2,3-diaminopropionate biosynthesis protein SbnA